MSEKLRLSELFTGGGEPWAPLLAPVIEAQPEAATFIGPSRDKAIVPVRELTFQALKPHAPADWKVVVFGQNPYPRVQSATGIAMFDNTFTDWGDAQFGKVTSIRCIIKAAAMSKHKLKKDTSVAALRAQLKQRDVVTPPEWFQAMLVQGVLLLNASLTASSDEALSTSQHTAFWKPIAEAIVGEILRAKQQGQAGGVVFAWWGSHAKALRKTVEKLQAKYPKVAVAHVDHCNPAAQGDMFCDKDPYAAINAALKKVGHDAVDWLPAKGWDAGKKDAARVGDFIDKTRDLHKLLLDRLAGVGDEKLDDLPPIKGLLTGDAPSLDDACAPIVKLHSILGLFVTGAGNFGKRAKKRGKLTTDEIAALFLYTTESPLYKTLNEALRHKDRARIDPYRGYLRLLLSALGKLKPEKAALYRGVQKDIAAAYSVGRTVTWWGVSSCTPREEVARAFVGQTGKRVLFELATKSAVSIQSFSVLTDEQELILPPGTRLEVTSRKTDKAGLSYVTLKELDGPRLVA